MVRARTVYIWIGEDKVTITRGYPFERYETTNGILCKGMVRHRGMFGSFVPVANIPEMYVGESKKLYVKNRILPQWESVIINMDYESHIPNTMNLNVNLISRLESLQKDVEIWKRRFYDLDRKLKDLEQKDRFIQKTKQIFKFVGDTKNLVYSGYGDSFSPYSYRYGLGSMPSTQSPQNE